MFGAVVDSSYTLILALTKGHVGEDLIFVSEGVDAASTLVGAVCKLGTDCVDSPNANVGTAKLSVEKTVAARFKVRAGTTINLANIIALTVVEASKKVGAHDKCCSPGTIISDATCLEMPAVESKGKDFSDTCALATGGYLGAITSFSSL